MSYHTEISSKIIIHNAKDGDLQQQVGRRSVFVIAF